MKYKLTYFDQFGREQEAFSDSVSSLNAIVEALLENEMIETEGGLPLSLIEENK